MIPALTIAFGQNQHLYQASAMVVNLFVALAAVTRHLRAHSVRVDAFIRMAPVAFVAIFVGVWASNRIDGDRLKQLFSVFLIYVIVMNLRKIVNQIRKKQFTQPSSTAGASSPDQGQKTGPDLSRGHVTTVSAGFVGAVMGFMAGLLGIGGGGIAVPLQQVVFRTPLRQCIGTSTSVICITAGFGAIYKNLTLGQWGISFWDHSFPVVIALVPGAVVGAYIGATLTHKLPTLWVRIAFVLLMAFVVLKTSGLIGG